MLYKCYSSLETSRPNAEFLREMHDHQATTWLPTSGVSKIALRYIVILLSQDKQIFTRRSENDLCMRDELTDGCVRESSVSISFLLFFYTDTDSWSKKSKLYSCFVVSHTSVSHLSISWDNSYLSTLLTWISHIILVNMETDIGPRRTRCISIIIIEDQLFKPF